MQTLSEGLRRDVIVEAVDGPESVAQPESMRTSQKRKRAETAARSPSEEDIRRGDATPSPDPTEGELRRSAASTCGWCDGPIERKGRGRIPKWCSAACRQRAWEQSGAAASGRSAVEIVERRVEIPIPQPSAPKARPRHAEWVVVLDELAAQLDTGGIYDRDLAELTIALNSVVVAFDRRTRRRRRTGGR